MPLIGEGNYGCVFRPSIKCKNKFNTPTILKSNKKVGKIFVDKLEFDNEKDIQKIISKIDPNNYFTLPLYEDCDNVSFKDSNGANKCNLINTRINDKYYQLTYGYGGISLKELLRVPGNPSKFLIVFSKLKPVLEGLQKLYDAKYVHQDVKPPNILFDTHKLYLIDFGIMTQKDKIYTEDNTYVLKYDYPYYPPEYKLYVNKNSSFNTFYKTFLANFDFIFSIGGHHADMLEYISQLGINIQDDLQKLYNKRYDKTTYSTEKIDIYSLGIVLLQLFIWSGLLSNNTSPSNHTSKREQLKEEIIKFIKGIIEFDIAKRYNFDELISNYNKITKLM